VGPSRPVPAQRCPYWSLHARWQPENAEGGSGLLHRGCELEPTTRQEHSRSRFSDRPGAGQPAGVSGALTGEMPDNASAPNRAVAQAPAQPETMPEPELGQGRPGGTWPSHRTIRVQQAVFTFFIRLTTGLFGVRLRAVRPPSRACVLRMSVGDEQS
jgi:hypothetical protein